jgi:transposase
LPEQPYTYAEWKKVRVHVDYHVEVEGHYYSVPYQLIREQLEARVSAGTIECFHKGQRIASHLRSFQRGRHTTLREHMPRSHQFYLDWTPERLVRWAQETGTSCEQAVETILTGRTHPQQGFRSCLGLLGLSKRYGRERLEAACRRVVALDICSYKSVKSILEKGLDKEPLPGQLFDPPEPVHPNIRGATYFH